MNNEIEIAWIKEIETEEYGIILAACDKELLGKKLHKGAIEVVISKRFYGGRLVTLKELKNLMRKADVLNLVGERVVNLAEEMGLIHSDAKIFFEDADGRKIPHAQMYRFFL